MNIKYIFIILFTSTFLIAYDASIVDEAHYNISTKVVATSEYIDDTLNNLFQDNNKTNYVKKDIQSIDSFYKNEKFIDETDESFVRIRVQSNHQTLDETSFDVKLRAYLSLLKTRQNIKLFIEDVNQDNYKDLPFKNSTSDDSSMAVGVSYLTLSYYDIDSKYSLGIRGLSPYIKVRYKKTFPYNDWEIKPAQSFTYSTKSDFKEETRIYFDRQLDKQNLFRIDLARSTKSNQAGMQYSLAFAYFYQPKKDKGISITQSFLGDTKYNYMDNGEEKDYSGIHTYSTDISWRESVWKKWFFYEIKPGIDFQKVYNYKINYKILFLTDFYFGYSN